MKKIFKITNLLIVAFIITSCGSTIDKKTISELLYTDNGTIAGVNIGDKFSDIKANADKQWKVVDKSTPDLKLYQLRKEWDDDNKILVTFDLDDNRVVKSFKILISGSGDNKDLAKLSKLDIFAYLNSKFSVNKIDDDTYTFIGSDNIKYEVYNFIYNSEEYDYTHLEVEFKPFK